MTAATQPVMIVNQTFAKRFFGNGNPIGRKVNGWGKWFTVVGASAIPSSTCPMRISARFSSSRSGKSTGKTWELPFTRATSGDPSSAVAAIRREVHQMDPNVGVYDAIPLTEYISASLFVQKMAASLLGALGAIALVLAAVGLYSVMAYSIAQRTQEIGIRMALGATPGNVLALVGRQAIGMVLVGTVVGSVAAVALTRMASGLLVRVSATDPRIFLRGGAVSHSGRDARGLCPRSAGDPDPAEHGCSGNSSSHSTLDTLRPFMASNKLMKFFLSLLLPLLASAAILPETIGPYHRTSTSQPTLADKPVWEEYGLKSSESGVFELKKRNLALQFGDFRTQPALWPLSTGSVPQTPPVPGRKAGGRNENRAAAGPRELPAFVRRV